MSNTKKTVEKTQLKNVNDKGTVTINEGVISSVVKLTLSSINDIVKLARNGSFIDGIVNMLSRDKNGDPAIIVNFDNDKLEISVNVIALYGVNLQKICKEAQASIIDKVKEVTGLEVTKVNIFVQDIEDREEINTEGNN